MLVSATLRDKLAKLATQLLRDPVAVGLQLRVAADATLQLQELQGAKEESFELPPGLQQLYMDVPTKLRLPTLIGAPSIRPPDNNDSLYTDSRKVPGVDVLRSMTKTSWVVIAHPIGMQARSSSALRERQSASSWCL